MKSNVIITKILLFISVLAPILIYPYRLTGKNSYIPKLIVLVVLGCMLLFLLLFNYKKLKIDNKDILMLCFLGLIYISTILSGNIMGCIIGADNRYEGLIMFLIYIVIYMCAKKIFVIGDNKHKIYNCFFYSALFIGILGLLQRYVNYDKLYPIFNKGICSTFGHHNFFGTYISIVLPIALSVFIIKGGKKPLLLTTIMFFNMMACGTRSAWVAFAVVFFIEVIFIIKQRSKEYYKRFFIVLILFVSIFTYLYNGIRITDILRKFSININNSGYITDSKNTTKNQVEKIKSEVKTSQSQGIKKTMGSSRIWIWTMTIELIKQKPLIGCGTDNLLRGLAIYTTDDFFEFFHVRNEVIDKAHNEYLHIASTIGIPALIIYLCFLVLILLPKIKQMLTNKISFIFTIVIISYLVQAFFNISTIGVAPLFWMILGFADNKNLLEKLDKYVI